MSYKMTLRRRLPSGELETATYQLVLIDGLEFKAEEPLLLFDLEMQANGSFGQTPAPRPAVRVWLEEVEE